MRLERFLYAMRMRLRALFRRKTVDHELDEELRYHLERATEENIAKGMTPQQARRAAMIEAGGIEQTKENCRDTRGLNWVQDFAQDVRFAFRMFRKNFAFTAIAVLTLAIGIGANTTIFTQVNAVLLRLLPVKDPGQLVLFTWDSSKKWPPNFGQTGADTKYSFSYPQFAEMREQNQVLSSMFAFVPLGFSDENVTVNRDGDATSANAMMVTGEYFSGLGVQPIVGRAITEADEQRGVPRVAVISYAYWNSRFGRDRSAIGSNVTLNGLPITIVGVAPPEFFGLIPGGRPDLWIAFDDEPTLRPWGAKPPPGSDSVYAARGWLCLNVVGRLKPGVSLQQAEAALGVAYTHVITADWKPARPQDVPGFSLTSAAQGMPYLRRFISQPLLFLMGAVAVVLLIACANVATLLLAKASVRSKEVSLRLAIGASRGRLVRQLLTESVMLSVMGGGLGFLFAQFGTRALLALPQHGPFAMQIDVSPDLRVLIFTAGAALLTGVLFGLAPALRASRVDLALTMKDSPADFLGGRGRHRLGQTLVIVQVAGCLMLLISAGLFLRTLVNLADNNFGFDQNNLLTFGLDATRDGYQGDRLIQFYSQLLDRMQALPGVSAATMMEFPPFAGVSNNRNVRVLGDAVPTTVHQMRSQTIGPDFFSTMRIPILLGRGIEVTDNGAAPKVVVVDETFAKKFFGNANPIGERIGSGKDASDSYQIVGVVKAAELTDVHATPVSKAYFSYQQLPGQLNSIYFEVRSTGNPESMISEIRDAVRRSDANLPLLSLETQTDIRGDALIGERIIARLSGIFGVIALVLTVIGLYGTIAYAVARKTHEIGIRMALGAAPPDVLRMVVAQGVKLASAGVAIGIIGALGVTRLVKSLMFGVSATDPATFIGVAIVLLAVTAAACCIPAWRAMRVDPMVALRHE